MGNLYNMVNGYSPACIYILPMLGKKENEYPRFRNCWADTKGEIEIYTRVGSANQNCGYEEDKLYEDENFIRFEDDEYDCTYGSYFFKVPDKWKKDFDLIMANKFQEVSQEYINVICEFYPKLADKIREQFK